LSTLQFILEIKIKGLTSESNNKKGYQVSSLLLSVWCKL